MKDDKPGREDIEFIVEARIGIQQQLLRLHNLEFDLAELKDEDDRKVGRLVGAAFSLWRAAPLVWGLAPRDVGGRSHRLRLLLYLNQDNAINYTQDKFTREWMGGYYVNSALARLEAADPDLAKAHNLPKAHDTPRAESEQEVWKKALNVLSEIVGSLEARAAQQGVEPDAE